MEQIQTVKQKIAHLSDYSVLYEDEHTLGINAHIITSELIRIVEEKTEYKLSGIIAVDGQICRAVFTKL